MIGSDLPHYIKYNPRIFAQANSTSTTGLVLESYDSKVSLALGNNSSNSLASNIIFLTSENNSFKIQYENSNAISDIVSYTFNNNTVNSVINGNQIADRYYVKDYKNTSIVLNDDPYKIAGIGYNKSSNSVNYNTTYDGKHVFKANMGSLNIDIASLYYSNSTQQLIIHGDGLNPQANNIPSLNVGGSAIINGNLNVNGAILGTFPSGVVQLNSNNKIEPSLLPQLAPDYRVLKSGRNIGIGTKNPISKLHIYNGDLLVQNGWIGINTNSNVTIAYPPKYPLHINYEVNTLPALVLTSNNIINFIAYADHPAIGIGTNKIDSPNIALYANGDIQCSNIIASGLNIYKNNEYVLYYEQYNTIYALVSKYPLVLNDKLYVSKITSSDTNRNINFSNCDIIVDGDIIIKNYSIQKLIDQYYSAEYIGFGVSCNLKYKLQVESSNAKTIAGFGSRDNDGALIYIYTSNNTGSNFSIGIDKTNNFTIRDNINGDITGINYSSDILKVNNIITSNITIISESGHIFNSSNYTDYNNLNNKPFYYENNFKIDKVTTSNSVKIQNITNSSALDICGKTRLYNENNIIPVQVECDIDSLTFLTNTGIPYKYINTNTINPLSLFISSADFLTSNTINKLNFTGSNHIYLSTNNKAYIDYNGVFSSNIIFNNPLNNVLDIAIDDNTVYYINNINNKIYYAGNTVNINTNTLTNTIDYSLLIANSIIYKKIKVGNNFGVILDDSNNLYSFGLNDLYQLGRVILTPFTYNIVNIITGLPTTLIKDFSCGNSHTAILYEDGTVWTFGDNTAYKRGYIGNPLTNNLLIPPNKITSLTEKIIKVDCSYNNTVLLSELGNVYISGDITNKLNILGTTPYLLQNIPKIIDISCGKNNVALLTYYNEIFTFNNYNTVGDYTGTGRNDSTGSQYEPKQIVLPYTFYNTSLYSHGSVIIGNNYFNTLSQNIPKNSLVIEGKVGIGTIPITSFSSNDYSMTIVGDMNLINGNIYHNGVLFEGTGQFGGSIAGWELTETSIYYKGLSSSYVGIGTTNPSRTLTVQGDIGLTGNIYVNDQLLINDFVLWSANKNSNSHIYYNEIGGKVGINTNNPLNSLDIYDTSTSIRNVVNISNLTEIDNNLILSLESIPLLTTTDFGNSIAISGSGNLIATSIFKSYDDSYNSNSVYIYKKLINNTWDKTTILSPIKEHLTFGNNLAVSQDGSVVVIANYNDFVMSGLSKIYTGSIYVCNVNNFSSNLINSPSDSNITIIYGPNNRYIGQNIAISYNANTIVSSAYADNTILYVYEKSGINYVNNNIDYTNVSYHTSFGDSQDISEDGTLIVSTFIINQMFPFLYNNIYIIKKINSLWRTPYFLTKNINNTNYIINNVSLSGDGSKLVMGITDNLNIGNKEVIYIYNLKDSYIFNNVYNISIPHYIIKLPSDNIFNAKISGDGFSILLTPINIVSPSDVKSYQYRYDKVLDSWISTKIEHTVNNIYTVKGDITDNGYNVVLASGNTILVNDRATTPLNSIIELFDIYEDKYTFYSDKTGNVSIGSNQTVPEYDLYVNGSIGTKNLVTDNANISNLTATNLAGSGEFINNININNINGNGSNILYGKLFIGNSNSITQSSNLYWNFDSNILYIDGTLNSKIIYSEDGFNIQNINLNSIGSNTILAIENGGTGTSNFLTDHLLLGNNNKINQSSNLLFNNNTLYVKGTTISDYIIGDGYNISNINILNINNGLIDVLYGGTGVSNLNNNQLVIGNSSNIYQTSNLYWDIINNRLGINNQNPKTELDIIGTITATSYIGDGYGISNIIASNLSGEVSIINGGTGCNNIPYGSILVGNNNNSIITTPNLIWNDPNNKLIINGYIYANNIQGNIIGDGYNLSNISASNIVGKLSTENGGIGDLSILKGQVFFGGNSNNILTSSNLYWNNSNNRLGINISNPRSELDVVGNITACYYIGNGGGISNIVASNIKGEISTINGGTGCNCISYGNIVVGNNKLGIITTPNLVWSNLNNKLIVKGDISANNLQGYYIGNGAGISNIVASNIIGVVSVINGGTGCNSIPYGNILVGNDNETIITSSNLTWDSLNNQLFIDGSIYANKTQGYFVGDAGGLSNIIFNNITGQVGVINGGTGCNILPYGNILVGNDQDAVIVSSNFVWINSNNQLLINGNIYANTIQGAFIGDGRGLSNLEYNDIVGEIQVINGGTSCNTIPYGSIVVGNDALGIITTPNFIWSNLNNKLIVKGDISANTVQGYYIGNGGGISNIVASNIIGTISVINGGTSCNTIPYGSVIVGNDNLGIITTPNFIWSNLNNKLIVKGDISANNLQGYYIGNGAGISNIVASNIIGTISVINGGTSCNTIPYGSVIVGNDNLGIITTPNFIWSNINNKLTINGDIYANTLQGYHIGNGERMSNIVASNIIGVLSVNNGGTGCNILNTGQILVGNLSTIYQSSNLYWNSVNNRLGINTSIPNYSLDIKGDINFNGQLLKDGNLYITPSGFSNLPPQNTIYTLSNLLLGYTEPDNNYRLKVNGKIYSSHDITAFSDQKYKTNIVTIDNALDKVNNLRGVYFNRTDINDERRHVGVIAQEIEKILPEVVTKSDTSGLSVAYGNITALLIEAIKDMSKRIEYLESKLEQ